MKLKLSKTLLLSAFSFLSLNSFSQSAQLLAHKSITNSSVTGISPNGKWASGSNGSNPDYHESAFLWNLETDEVSFISVTEAGDNLFVGALDVANDGTVVGSLDGAPAIYKNGQWTKLSIPEEFDAGTAIGVSADGTVIIGYLYLKSGAMGGEILACKWINEELQKLNLPETDSKGNKPTANQPMQISSDGQVIFGCLNRVDPSACTPLIWAPEPEIICEDIYYNDSGDRNYTELYRNMYMSSNAKLITGFADYDIGSTNVWATFLYDVEKKETTVYQDGEQAFGLAIDNNGTIYEGTENSGPVRTAYIRIDGKQQLLNEYLLENYNFDITTTEYQDLGTVCAISDDNKTLIGFEGPSGNWCLKLSEAPVTSSVESQNSNKVTVSVYNKILTINGDAQQVIVNDLTGNTILNQQVSGNNVSLNGISSGVYVVTLKTEGQNIVQKIMVK